MAKAIDLTGQKFGRLTVLYRDPKKDKTRQARWICQCECGTIKSYLSSALRSGGTVSCGCYGKEQRKEGAKKWIYSQKNKEHCREISQNSNLIGKKFGKLLIIDKTDLRKYQNIVWKCKCDCGNITYVPTNSLTKGDTKSCGCIKSYGEEKISKLLQQNNIPFIREFIFPDCVFPKTKAKARFDFYVNNQYVIEFDGKQHFTENSFFQQSLEDIQNNDNIKNQYCKQHSIPMIRIPYYHLKDLIIEDLLLDKTKFLI